MIEFHRDVPLAKNNHILIKYGAMYNPLNGLYVGSLDNIDFVK